MKRLMLAALLMVPAAVYAQQVCDVTYTVESETSDGTNVGTSYTTLFAVPMSDVLDNHQKQIKVLDVASKQQDAGGQYRIDIGEYRTCADGAKVKITDGSAMLLGVTLKGSNLIGREALKQADLILKRYEQRAGKGEKTGWDHSKGPKVQRDPDTHARVNK